MNHRSPHRRAALNNVDLRDAMMRNGGEGGFWIRPIHYFAKWRGYWDLMLFIVIAVVSVVVPLRIGFLVTEWEAWLPLDVVVLVILTADIFITAQTTFDLDGEEVRKFAGDTRPPG
jgi:hypothetical protein